MIRKIKENSFFSGTAVYLFSNILNAAIPFALLPVLTRYLSPAQYGQVAMFQTLQGALGPFVGVGVIGAAGRKYYDGNQSQHEFQHFIASCLQILMMSSVLVFIVVTLTRRQLSEWMGLDTLWVMSAVVASAASVIIQLRLGQWQVRKEALNYSRLQLSQSALNLVLSFILVVIFLWGANGRIAAQVVTSGIFALLALFLLRRDGLLSFLVWKPAYLKDVLAFGVPLIPHIGGIFLLTSVDRFVIKSELGIAEAGIYMVAVQLSSALGLVFDAINNAYVPWLFERLKRDLIDEKRQIVRYTYAWFVLIMFGVGIAFLIGPWLVTCLAGAKYGQAGLVIGWLALGQAFNGMYLMITNYVFYSKRTGMLSLATVISGLINIILLIALIRLLGLKGAAIAYSISMAIRFLLSWWVSHRSHPMPWFEFNR